MRYDLSTAKAAATIQEPAMKNDPISNLISGVEATLPLIDTSSKIGRTYVAGMTKDIALLRGAMAELAIIERRELLDDGHAAVLTTIAITSGDFGRYVRLFGDEDLPNLRA
jgi:hypothetical protein